MHIRSRIFQTGLLSSAVILAVISFTSCNQDDNTPKPRGYFRIALPEKQYRTLDSIYPYTFEYPHYVNILPDAQSPEEKNWINLGFYSLRGTLHLSYKPVNNIETLNTYIEDSRALAMKHIPKASSIEQISIAYPEHNVYGLVYDIKGLGAASPYQFYATDSLHHFMRGALYFNAVPNSDSLMPVINFVKQDIHHLIETLRWK
jgi:gliding motility-associated lipoprotein GldD